MRQKGVPVFGPVSVQLDKRPAPSPASSTCGLSILAHDVGPQVAVMAPASTFAVALQASERVDASIPVSGAIEPLVVSAEVTSVSGVPVDVQLAVGDQQARRRLTAGESAQLTVTANDKLSDCSIICSTFDAQDEGSVRWSRLQYQLNGHMCDVPLQFPRIEATYPPPIMPPLRPSMERQLIEWDWRMQDGIGTQRQSRSWAQAVATLLDRGDLMLNNLRLEKVADDQLAQQWESLREDWNQLSASSSATQLEWESLWRRAPPTASPNRLEQPTRPDRPLDVCQTSAIVFQPSVDAVLRHVRQAGWRNIYPGYTWPDDEMSTTDTPATWQLSASGHFLER